MLCFTRIVKAQWMLLKLECALRLSLRINLQLQLKLLLLLINKKLYAIAKKNTIHHYFIYQVATKCIRQVIQ